MNTGRSKRLTALTAGIALVTMLGTTHARSPMQNCQSGKNKAAGMYSACRQNAEAKFVTSPNSAKRTLALAKCLVKYAAAWPALEARAAAKGGACPSVGDQATIQGVVDQHTGNIATALGGGALSDCSTDLLACQGGLGACRDNLATCRATPPGRLLQTGATLCSNTAGAAISCSGTGQDGEFQKGVARSFTDNGNGTITDSTTGLMWEKLSDDGSIHDKDGLYTWATAVTTKVAALNSASFAGFNDWRLPNQHELYSLVSLVAENPAVAPPFYANCVASCTVLTCSCIQTNYYWSSTSGSGSPSYAWLVNFATGSAGGMPKATSLYVRGVRGGS